MCRVALPCACISFRVAVVLMCHVCWLVLQGWIDITYMNPEGTFRIARGNKGTLFILQKDIPLKQQLLQAAEAGDDQQVGGTMEVGAQGVTAALLNGAAGRVCLKALKQQSTLEGSVLLHCLQAYPACSTIKQQTFYSLFGGAPAVPA
jgi:hypothetical protein